ncbi:peptidase M14 family protein [Candidatus Bathyarchaeota archaeon]|nr:peptidase M14 family protein [Candidatus Bathyarchaeota archaeon]
MSSYIISPEEFFGHKMGADRKLERWDKIVEYFGLLSKSPCVEVTELGKTTEGNPFLFVIISSSDNIKNLEKIREMSYNIAHPKDLKEKEVKEIISKGKTVVAMSMSLHATEIGGTQMAPELAYEFATLPEYEEVRKNTVLLMFPSFNPDGQIIVTDWYNKWLGTEYEGLSTPKLYHKYVGHDNNRDAITNLMVESKYMSQIMYKEWHPQAYIDFHHMGSTGARYYIPPFANPVDENVDPLIWTEQELYGGLMHVLLEKNGCYGIESAATYPGEFMPTFNYVPCWHNICGMLTESASASLATPLYVHPHQLRGSSRGRPENHVQMGFPHPWLGGWWTLRDIVKQQKTSAIALLQAVSSFRETILNNMYIKATRSITKGNTEPPFAFVIKPSQHDELTAYKFIKMLMDMNVEVNRSQREFVADGITYPRGTYIIFASQTCRPYLMSLLKRTFYRVGPYSKRADGTPITPYDLAAYTVPEFMGVKIHEVQNFFDGTFESLPSLRFPRGDVAESAPNGWLVDSNVNDAFAAINRLLRKGIEVCRLLKPVKVGENNYGIGSWHIIGSSEVKVELNKLARRYHLIFEAAPSEEISEKPTKLLRIGMYQRLYGGNMDEGWTRWLLEQYRFNFKSVTDKDIKKGKLINKLDVLIFPSDSKQMITGEGIEEYYEKRFQGMQTFSKWPDGYKSGIGKEGVDKVKEFIKDGGTVLALNESSNFAIEEFKLPVKNMLIDVKPTEFTCPGSTLHVNVDSDNQLAWGVQKDLLIIFRSPLAFEIRPGKDSYKSHVVLNYPEERIMESGWLNGEEKLSRRAAMVEVNMDKGRVVLYGFSPQFRAQSDASFKLLFNALLG